MHKYIYVYAGNRSHRQRLRAQGQSGRPTLHLHFENRAGIQGVRILMRHHPVVRTRPSNTLHSFIPVQTLLPHAFEYAYGAATISRLLKIIGLFYKRALQKRRYSAKETRNFKEPTNRSHPIRFHAEEYIRHSDTLHFVEYVIHSDALHSVEYVNVHMVPCRRIHKTF